MAVIITEISCHYLDYGSKPNNKSRVTFIRQLIKSSEKEDEEIAAERKAMPATDKPESVYRL